MSIRFWLLASFAVLAVVMVATAQSGERAPTWFGPGVTKAKAPADNTRRLAEIAVELAWMADPVTFPYYLEARVDGTTLSVRGFVPDKAVRDYALRLARLYCSFSVADALKEHPSLRVRPGQMAPAQLQTAAVTALREALPKQQAQRLQVECAADGKVTLRGPVQSPEEKLAVSLALRRLFGCTSVQNLTQAPGAPDFGLAKVAPPPLPKKSGTEAAKTDKAPAPSPLVVEGPNLFQTKPTDPPAKKETPISAPPANPPVVGTTEKDPAKASAKLSLSPTMIAMLQKRVQEGCPGVKDVKIAVALNKLRIELTVGSDNQITAAAEKVFNVPELADYRDNLELVFAVAP